ncbi:outer membrane beta-barrel protein [Aquabacterium sp.]|uniref:outer membrane beta-barrel protein n=1 Tax=Aquabacterium sp. TaxID=1872578 RepID=UPI0035B0E3EE
MNTQQAAILRLACLLSVGFTVSGVALAQAPAAPVTTTATETAVGTAVGSGAEGFESGGVPASGQFQPGSLRLGDGNLVFTPMVTLGLGYNDNLTLAPTSAQSSSFISAAPSLVLSAQYGVSKYSLGYRAEAVHYNSYSDYDYENQEVAASGAHDLDTRFAFNWRASYQNQYDPVGSTDVSTSNKPDRYQASNFIAAGRYGAKEAQGNIEGEVGYYDKKYLNHRASTLGSDYASLNVVGRFLYRVGPKTQVLTEYRHTDFDYSLNTTNQDNTEQRLLVGTRWEATAATSGEFKVGYLSKDYNRVRKDFHGSTWEGGLKWQPLTYSTFGVTTGRGASDATGTTAQYITNSYVGLTWDHNWRSYFSTRVGLTLSDTTYVGGNREDRTNELMLGASYVVSRWSRVTGEYRYGKRNSDDNTYDYDRNLLTVKLDLAF